MLQDETDLQMKYSKDIVSSRKRMYRKRVLFKERGIFWSKTAASAWTLVAFPRRFQCRNSKRILERPRKQPHTWIFSNRIIRKAVGQVLLRLLSIVRDDSLEQGDFSTNRLSLSSPNKPRYRCVLSVIVAMLVIHFLREWIFADCGRIVFGRSAIFRIVSFNVLDKLNGRDFLAIFSNSSTHCVSSTFYRSCGQFKLRRYLLQAAIEDSKEQLIIDRSTVE